jgi:hypothetical protein
MSSSGTESLRLANGNLRAGLSRLQAESSASDLDEKDLSSLLSLLLRAGDCLRSIPPDAVPDEDLEKEISEYRSTVEQLAEVLPRIHGKLLTEKARLEIARAHVAATAAWAQTSRKTL